MTTLQFLTQIRDSGIELWLEEGNRLRFRARKGAMTTEIRDGLRLRKNEIVAFLSQTAKLGDPDAETIRPVPRDRPLPLSFAQQRLWLIDRMDPGSPAYNLPLSRILEGPFDLRALEQAFNAIRRRHEVLRTVFIDAPGQPVQEVLAYRPQSLTAVDLSTLPEEDRDLHTRRLATRVALHRFPLERGPLIRFQVFRLHFLSHVLSVNMHHIVTDEWSMNLFENEAAHFYQAFLAGTAPRLPSLSIQYADFANRQRQWLEDGGRLAKQRGYWLDRLAGELPTLALPTDRPRGPVADADGAVHGFVLSESLSRRLNRLARGMGVTPYTLLVSAFSVLLARYSGQGEICIGSPVAGRNLPQIEPLIGFFVNTLVLRAKLNGDPGFDAHCRSLKPVVLDAFSNQDFPFEKLVEDLDPKRMPNRTPLFQALFNYREQGDRGEPDRSDADGALRSAEFGFAFAIAKFDLTLTAVNRPGSLFLSFRYKTALWDDVSIRRMARHFRSLMASAADDPSSPVGRLPLMDPAERGQVLWEWNQCRPYPGRAPWVHQLIARRAAAVPDRLAISRLDGDADPFGLGGQVSYRWLDRRAAAMARHLRDMGTGPEKTVGVLLERGPDLLAAVLAILRAGGAFVPLDPEHPKERLAYLARDAGADLVITQASFREKLPKTGTVSVYMESLPDISRSATVPEPTILPQHPAYLIYTSGSTGNPKGVVVAHQTLKRYLTWVEETLFGTGCPALPAVTALSFDACLKQLLSPLQRGETVRLVARSAAGDPAVLVRVLDRFGLSGLNCVPSLWQAMLTAFRSGTLPLPTGLRALLLGGEHLEARLLAQTREMLPHLRVWNLYGPTETTANASAGRLDSGLPITVGRPLPYLRIYLLDPSLNPVPIGVPGQIFIGGGGLARGYRNRGDLTGDRFVPDPLSGEPGARWFRTGDRGLFHHDGRICFLGRADRQLKLRGYRIEPGEIEAVLRGHEAVAEAATVLADGPDGTPRLVALVAGEPGAKPDPAALRRHLKARLPEYMLPAGIRVLDRLPRNPSGKLDRRELAAMSVQITETAAFVAPRNPVESLLATVWEKVLDREPIGVETDFFDLGGHSLLAAQVVSRAKEAFDTEIPLRVVFERPTIAGLAYEITRLRQENRQGGGSTPSSRPIVPAKRDGPLPLSFAQQRLWFINQLDPGSPAYNVPMSERLPGPLAVSVLERSLGEIARRHEVLRTRFSTIAGQPVQLVADRLPEPLTLTDLSGLAGEIRLGQAGHLAKAEAGHRFDLEKSAARFKLLCLDEYEHVLLVNLHHTVTDAWSNRILRGETHGIYDAFLREEPCPLAPLEFQYGDFAVWQRTWMTDDELDRQRTYWLGQLENAPKLNLPTDRARPRHTTSDGALYGFGLGVPLSRRLRQRAREQGSTLFMAMLGAFHLMLSRYSGQRDICIGTVTAGRSRAELEPMIGFFVNTLVIRADLSGNPSYAEFLKRIRTTALDAFAHQDIPFEKLVEALQPERDAGNTPLFDVAFNFHEGVSDQAALPPGPNEGGDSPAVYRIAAPAKFDITLTVVNQPALAFSLEYKTALFDDDSIEAMARHLANLLADIDADPGRRVDAFSLMDATERQSLVAEWNRTRTDFPRDAGIAAGFASMARRYPERIALTLPGGDVLTYACLDRIAERLARSLRGFGVGPETVVCIRAARSLEMVAAMLATLKAGGAYLPADPGFPEERLTFLLEDSGAKVFASGSPLDGLSGNIAFLDLARVRQKTTAPDDGWAPTLEYGNGLAYLIYTSGSTGRPKGVAVSHAAVNRLVLETDYLSLGPESRLAHLSNVAFDAATFEIWGALLNGVLLAVAGAETGMPAELERFIAGLRIDTLFLTTALLNQVAAQAPKAFRSLDTLLFGGEAVDPSSVRTILEQGAPRRMLHVYGPTENTTFSSWHRVTEVAAGAAAVPIGRPIANSTGHVVDAYLKPVPGGVPGELFLGGAGVGRGYWRRPELTAERFVPDDFGGETGTGPGARLYKTGDLVRLVRGELAFLNRIDHQVKLRGFRIELGEIEQVLMRHPNVREAVVLLKGEHAAKRLVAYVRSGENRPARTELATFVKETLPGYMVPAATVFMESFPLTPNGKVARDKLPEPEATAIEPETEYIAPSTVAEELLAGIWAEVLGIERIGIHDNFFDLGGHSLLATRMMSRLREAFSVDLPLRLLFEKPTIGFLSGEIAFRLQGQGTTSVSPPVAVPRDRELPLSFAQQRLWFIDQMNPGTSTYNIPIAERLQGTLAAALLGDAFTALAARHESLRTRFPARQGKPYQDIRPPAPVPFPVVDLSALESSTGFRHARTLASREAGHGFDLATGPLMRVHLLRLAPADHVLLVNQHHIVTDGWSVDITRNEVAVLYEGSLRNIPEPLPALPLQYADFSFWQRQWLQGELLDAQLAYWTERLGNLPPALTLPSDRSRVAGTSSNGESYRFGLDPELSGGLRGLARSRGNTPFMTVLAAFQLLLGRYSGQQTVSVGTPVAGRNHLQTEPLVGFFVNTLVLAGDLSGNPTCGQFLDRVRETALGAFTHQDIPFEKLVDELQPERDLNHTPLFQVLFNFHEAAGGEQVSDLELRGPGRRDAGPAEPALFHGGFDFEIETVKFDLTLTVLNHPAGMILSFRYKSALFAPTAIRRMAHHLRNLMAGMVGAPDRGIASLPLLSAAEQHRQLAEWNDSRRDTPIRTVPELFAGQARKIPDGIALAYETDAEGRDAGKSVQVSFDALQRKTRSIAARLRSLGVGPESAVGLCYDRGPDMIAGLLAALAAGGAYVPLDPSLPKERLSLMLADSGAWVLMVQPHLIETFGDFAGSVLVPEAAGRAQTRASISDEVTPAATDPGYPAYIIYTSGSTGTPKGVVIEHRAIANYVDAIGLRLGPVRGLSFALVSTIAVDLGHTAVYPSLCGGGRLHVLTRDQLTDPLLFQSYMARHRIDALKIVPSHLAALQPMDRDRPALPAKILVLGGEASLADWAAHLAKKVPGCLIFNHYGPTETTVGTLTFAVGRPTFGESNLPLGAPLANTRAFVLDAGLRPVPVSVRGELFIAGAGLARGYHRAPVPTATRFLPNPFTTETEGPGSRLYRTGDAVRGLADGTAVFLGRIDFQVKLRGHRLELGEIEAALRGHSRVRDCVVALRGPLETEHVEKRLVAYVVTEEPGAPSWAELGGYLESRLPEYAIPTVWVGLAALPLTQGGKVDRKALPEPGRELAAREKTYVAPRDAVEEVLASIWCAVLGLDRVSVDDGFFALGGHSLLATQLMSRIHEAFELYLPLRTLFERTTIAQLAPEIDNLRRQGSPGMPEPVPVSRDAELPLSFAQQRLWFIDQLDPGAPTYNVPVAERMHTPLDIVLLQRTFGEIMRRHEVLRTRFPSVGGKPGLVVEPAGLPRLPLIDLSGLAAGTRETETQRIADRSALHRFRLEAGPLAVCRVVRLDTRVHVLLAVLHHIVTDGWSRGIFRYETAVLYEAMVMDRPSPLPELALQYADYAVWQRQWLQGDMLEAQLAYWRERLGDDPPALALPLDFPRQSSTAAAGATYRFHLKPSLNLALRSLARQESATIFMTLMAGFQSLLCRYSGQEDISVGTPVAGRTHLSTEPLIGFFINALVLRSDFREGPGFREVLKRVREAALGAFAHQDLPFEKLVECLQPERDLGRTPYFQVMFNFHDTTGATQTEPDGTDPSGSEPASELFSSPFDYSFEIAKFDLTLTLVHGSGGIFGSLQYNRNLFRSQTVRRMAAHLQFLMEAGTTNPETRLGDLAMLSDAERHQAVLEWNRTGPAYPRDSSIQALFERWARETPNAVAVGQGPRQVSYGALNRRANRLAFHLRRLGIGPEVPVGVFLERSLETSLAVVGILKAGGAYVPLDMGYPRERLGFMLADTHAPVVLTRSDSVTALPETEARLVQLDRDWDLIAQRGARNPSNRGHGRDLAYIVYTSGSTGRPKGSAIPHRAVIRLVIDTDYIALGRRDVMGQVANTSFDAATLEIWGALLNGGRIAVVSKEIFLTPERFFEKLRAEYIAAAFLTVSVFNRMALANPSGFECMRWLLFGGEAANPETVALVRRSAPGLHLLNGYGPTENTTFSVCYPVPDEPFEGSVPIGRPIANSQGYVLNRRLRPVPVGVHGELYLGGDGLARDYHRRPALTAAAFVPNPFGVGSRLYKTGDLVRTLPDGVLDFIGRVDFQVKLRGFRIELGEIETRLAKHPGVGACAVTLREEPPGNKLLAAFLTRRGRAEVPPRQLRDFLAETLADFMIPSVFVFLDALPLTPNGKADRAALARTPLPDPARNRQGAKPAVLPRDPLEGLLAGIWNDVLGLDGTGIHDDFFELGGHSLLATQLMSRVREAFAIELPLRTIFELPSVAGFAERVRFQMGRAEAEQAPPLVPVTRESEPPLSFAQQRLWLIDRMAPGAPTYHVPLAETIEAPLDLSVLERVFDEIVRRHEALRTCFPEVDGRPVQRVLPAELRNLEQVDLSGLTETDQFGTTGNLAHADAVLSFDLAHGPPARFRLLRLAPARHVLLANLHHIVTDGWSMRILRHEVAVLYRAFLWDEPSPLPLPSIQYADYADWQRRWLQGSVLEAQRDFWRETLQGAPALLTLATDRPRPLVMTTNGARYEFGFDRELSRALERLARKRNGTAFMVLMAGLQVLLGRYSGQDDICVGTPVAGRNRKETEPLIGFFVNTLVLRGRLSGNPSFAEVLGRIRDASLGAFSHQDLPFEKLVEDLQPERDMGHAPLFQVMFNYHETAAAVSGSGEEPEAAEAAPWYSRNVDNAFDMARFDLTLTMVNRGGHFEASLQYNRDLFHATTALRMAGHFQNLLRGLADRADLGTDAVSMLTDAESAQLLREWNRTRASFPEDSRIQELFESGVAATPDAVAIGHGSFQLGYRTLNRRAEGLAERLKSLGIGTETTVGVCLNRSVDFAVALLAVLKAGGVYVPLDPEYPEQRLSFMIQDIRAPLILTQPSLLQRLPEDGTPRLTLDDFPEKPGPFAKAESARPNLGQCLAYIIYTSGSTGVPKGIGISHGSVIRTVRNTDYLPLTASGRIAQSSNIAFDAATFEVWGALLNGAYLEILEREDILREDAFPAAIQARRITAMFLTTALFNQMATTRPEAFRSLRTLLFGGEKVSPEPVRLVREAAPNLRLLHVYGPTENTTFSTWHPVSLHEARSGTIPIGRPIANSRCYVLDARMRPVPVGVRGELFLAGSGLARGYVGRPAKTASSFVPDPFGHRPGRLYRSGDRVKLLPNGAIEFGDRADFQVKLRGFRIELGEIETRLAVHPDVGECKVLLVGESSAEKRLVAFIAARGGENPSPSRLRDHLAEDLAEFMIPSVFVFLASMPLTPNGKVDRDALAALPIRGQALQPGRYEAPRNPVEGVLASIWSELLAVERVGIHDVFFELGGHSLLATRLTTRVRESFRVALPLRAVFEHPTVAGLAQAIEAERREDPKLLPPPMIPVEREGLLPLSFAQSRLWFIDQFEPGTPAYNVPLAERILLPLDVSVLERALGEIVRRHEVLRTRFQATAGEPGQAILPFAEESLPLIDLTGLGKAERERESTRLAGLEAHHRFDLERGHLRRFRILRNGAWDHVLLANLHHIVTDGWSMDLLRQELLALYAAFFEGRPSPLPVLALQYADFAAWQRDWLKDEILATHLDYWKARLVPPLPVLNLTTDFPRPAMQTANGASYRIALSPVVSRELRALARVSGSTPFMVLLAAFKVLLFRYCGQDDICIGTPVANRNHLEIEGLIGFFVNTLVLRDNLRQDQTFPELLDRVRNTALDGFAHQDIPFEKLVEELQPERDLSHTPLFQAMFSFHEMGGSSAGEPLPGVEYGTETPLFSGSFDNAFHIAKFDLTLTVAHQAEGMTASFEYRTDLFQPSTMARFAGHYAHLLAAVWARPHDPIAALPLLSPAENHQLLREWNQTQQPVPGQAIHTGFELQAARVPDRAAVTFEDRTLTYAALNRGAGGLARHLRLMGIGPGSLAGICMERRAELVTGLLAILKSGGAYVPIDPEFPGERIAFMLADAAAPVVLCHASGLGTLSRSGVRPVVLDSSGTVPGSPRSVRLDSEDLSGKPEPGATAYVIYTSGSTGKPKGVKVSHGAVVNFLQSMSREPGIEERDILLAVTTVSFDIAGLELYLPLITGANVTIASRETLADGILLARLLDRCGASIMQATPATWRLLLAAGWAGNPSLKILCGGEALSRELGRHLVDMGASLRNLYGPTETTIWSTIRRVRGGESPHAANSPVSIGKPIDNTLVYVLNSGFRPVPMGVPGELAIGGAGVADGYLGRPALTAEKFVPEPFSGAPGSRMYRTGDLVRSANDGDLSFLGRIDFQVKVRGFRIELGEIETVLEKHPRIRQAVTVIREDAPGEGRLIAYYTQRDGDAVSGSGLAEYLRHHLADYMIPAAFVGLASMPLTPNGKVDRKQLPAPELSRRRLGGAYAPARNQREALSVSIWQEVLGLEPIGIHDDFFQLGGHSLLATRLIARTRQSFGIDLALRALFERPTIAGLTEEIEIQRQAGKPAPPAIVAVDRGDGIPISLSQQRLWFIDRMDPGDPTYNVPMAERLNGSLDAAGLEWALNEIIRRHEVLRTVFAAVEGRPVQKVQPFAFRELAVIDLGGLVPGLAEETARRVAGKETRYRFDLERGPLIRFNLIGLTPESRVLLANLHHIVTDGWSGGILRREAATLYESGLRGEPSPLPELAIQFGDYAAWQHRWLRGEPLERLLAYWREQLGPECPILQLPTDRPRPVRIGNLGRTHVHELPQQLSDDLRALARKRDSTPFMALLAGFQLLMAKLSGQKDFCVGTAIAGRTQPQIEPLIGFFVNTLVLRASLGGNPSFSSLLERVRDTALQAYAHQELPFEKLVEALQPERSLSHSPLFQVMFNFHEVTADNRAIDMETRVVEEHVPEGFSSRFAYDYEIAKFDITVTVVNYRAMAVTFEYKTDLFEAETVRRFAGYFENLLIRIAADPGRTCDGFSLMTGSETERMLRAWNRTESAFDDRLCFHRLFELVAARTPDAPALAFEDRCLSYAGLNTAADSLALVLRKKGVGMESPVGIFMERCPEMAIGLLAALKAGGAYLPLDVSFPKERIGFIIEDAGVNVVLTQRQLRASMGSLPARLVYPEEIQLSPTRKERRPAIRFTPGQLAYIIYTSGSTGQPKGTLLQHAGLCSLSRYQARALNVSAASRVLQFASLSFDASTWEVAMAFGSGASLVLARAETLMPGPDLSETLEKQAITHLTLPPSALAKLSAAQVRQVRTVVVAGEACPGEIVSRFAPGRRFVNAYGPTETTVCATLRVCRGDEAVPPIGRPIGNTRVFVLDRHLRPVPLNVSGELLVAGVGLARGYLGRPDLTACFFVPDPFSPHPGGRLYRTGDLVCWQEEKDGTPAVAFRGRIDFQAKVRGYRVELGEVEACLRRHPGVRDCALTALPDREGQKRLVAYVIGEEPEAPDANRLRAFLERHLPAYMIPSFFVPMERFPLTVSGKVDLKALPDPERALRRSGTVIEPRTRLELRVRESFEEVLHIRPIGATDNFFELGGHSLLAVPLMERLNRLAGKALPLAALFRNPTVEALAAALARGETEHGPERHTHLITLQPGGDRAPLFLVHPVGGHVFGYMGLCEKLGRGQPVHAFQAQGLDNDAAPFGTIEAMAEAYLGELESFYPQGAVQLGGWSLGGVVAFEMARRLRANGREVLRLALIDAQLAPPSNKQPTEGDLRHGFARDLGIPLSRDAALEEASVDRFLGEVSAQAKNRLRQPPQMPPAQFARLYAVYKAHALALLAYRPEAYAGEALLLRAARSPRERHRAWTPLFRKEALRTVDLTGDHYSILEPSQLPALAAELEAYLLAIPKE